MSNTKILVENHQSTLLGCPEEVYSKIHKALRFRDRGYFHSVLYKRKLWDGFIEFMKKDNGKFLTGLLPEIEGALKMLEVEYEFIDQRTNVDFLYEKIDQNFLNQWLKPSWHRGIFSRRPARARVCPSEHQRAETV